MTSEVALYFGLLLLAFLIIDVPIYFWWQKRKKVKKNKKLRSHIHIENDLDESK
jgi:hypothetical protein